MISVLDFLAALFSSYSDKKMQFPFKTGLHGRARITDRVDSDYSKVWDDEHTLNTISLSGNSTEITKPSAILDEAKKTTNNELANKMNPIKNERPFVVCNLCESDVASEWMTAHIAAHIENKYVLDSTKETRKQASRSHNNYNSSIVPVVKSPPEPAEPMREEDLKEFLNILTVPKINDYPEFQYREVRDVSCTGSSSKDGRYSDFNIYVWYKETISTYNAIYTGGSSSGSKVAEKLHFHMVFDSVDKYYTLSARLYKRNSYSEVDLEEGSVPDRICDQKEITIEIRRALLYFRTNPDEILKLFLEATNKEISSIKDEDIFISHNHAALLEAQKKSSTFSHSSTYLDNDMCGA